MFGFFECRYHEVNLTVGKNKTNIWFIGDGKGKTIISGSRSVVTNNVTTSKTPTFGNYTNHLTIL